MSRRLAINPGPLKIVSADVRDVWTRPYVSEMGRRCDHEDGRGQCRAEWTARRWNGRYVERYCDKHMPKEWAEA